MKKDQLMAVDEKTLDQAMGMLLANDYSALAQLEMQGQLMLSKGGEQVALENVKLRFLSASKKAVRIKGSAEVWWVYIDATEEKPAEETPAEKPYDHVATEAEYLKALTDILTKSKVMIERIAQGKISADTPGKNAQLLINRGKKLENEGEVADVQYWRAAKTWLEMGIPPKQVAELMPAFADTLIGADGTFSDFELPKIMGDAIFGKRSAIKKLDVGLKPLSQSQWQALDEQSKDKRVTQLIQVLSKRYEGANKKARDEGETPKP